MEQAPTLAQIIRQAIDTRLLDVHTALVGRVEKYDASTQLADIQPVIKHAIKNSTGGTTQEVLPLLVDVPVLFPRAARSMVSACQLAPSCHSSLDFLPILANVDPIIGVMTTFSVR